MKPSHDGDLAIVHLLGEAWRTCPRRPHVAANSKYARVLCIERARRQLAGSAVAARDGNGTLRQVSESLWLYEPSRLLPHLVAASCGPAGWLNKRLLREQVHSVLKRLNFEQPAVIVAHPLLGYLADIFPASVICYEVTDNWATWGGGRGLAKLLAARAEDRLLSRCDVVVASAYALYQDKAARHERTFYVPNSAEVDHFKPPENGAPAPPADLAELPRPWIGFAGNIMDAIDMDLLAASMQLRPDWSWVFVGRVNGSPAFVGSAAFRAWRHCPNAHQLGWRDYEVLPQYVRAFDVCILPYARGTVMYGALPNKIFQYLAAGRPVVSTRFPETAFLPDDLREALHIADTPEQFCDAIHRALAADCQERRRQRVRVAEANSCDVRARQRVQILRECVAEGAGRHQQRECSKAR
jgi:glycosyltransferase involved in cell wall biosynthesis